MFTIRHKPSGLYCPKSDVTYFIEDDDGYRLHMKNYAERCKLKIANPIDRPSAGASFGKKKKYMKVFSSTEHIRRALGTVKYKTDIVMICKSLQIERIQPCKEKGIGTFTMYEVVNLITGECHKLEDVFNKKI